MIENNSTNVFAAFEILLGEIEVEIDFCHKAGAEAFERRDLEDAREVLEYAGQIMVFRDKIVSLSKEWETLSGVQRGSAQEEMTHVEQRSQGRLQRGLRTPEEAYYQPILQILNEQGGSAKMSDVQERLAQVMKGVLREVPRVAQRDEESEESRLMGNVYRSRRGIQTDWIGWTGGKIRAFQSPER